MSLINKEIHNESSVSASEQARQMALEELRKAGIEPESRAEQDFLFRVQVFGIMGVQPPIVRRES